MNACFGEGDEQLNSVQTAHYELWGKHFYGVYRSAYSIDHYIFKGDIVLFIRRSIISALIFGLTPELE